MRITLAQVDAGLGPDLRAFPFGDTWHSITQFYGRMFVVFVGVREPRRYRG